MPPVYLVACKDDPVVLYENSVRFYENLKKQGVDCTFALYDWGGHGFGMKNNAFMKAFHWDVPVRKPSFLSGCEFKIAKIARFKTRFSK